MVSRADPVPESLPVDDRWPRAGHWLSAGAGRNPIDVAVLGIPTFARSRNRAGTHSTPAAVRRALHHFTTWSASRHVDLADLWPWDVGDVDEPDRADGEWRARTSVATALAKSRLLIALGGDGSATVPLVHGLGPRDGRPGRLRRAVRPARGQRQHLGARDALRGRTGRRAGRPSGRGRLAGLPLARRRGAGARPAPVFARACSTNAASPLARPTRSHRLPLRHGATCMCRSICRCATGRLRPPAWTARRVASARLSCSPRPSPRGRDPRVRSVDIVEVDAGRRRARLPHRAAGRSCRARGRGRARAAAAAVTEGFADVERRRLRPRRRLAGT